MADAIEDLEEMVGRLTARVVNLEGYCVELREVCEIHTRALERIPAITVWARSVWRKVIRCLTLKSE